MSETHEPGTHHGNGPPPPHYLAAIESLLGDIENLVEAMVASYRTNIHSYRAMRNRALFPEVKAASKGHATLILTRMAEGRSLTPGDLRELGTLGKLRYEQGVPLSDLTEAYKWGARVVEHHLLRAFSGPGEERPAFDEWASEAIHRHTTHAGVAIAQAYLQAKQGVQDRAERGGRLFVEMLEAADGRRATEAALRLGFQAEDHHVVVVVDCAGSTREPARSRLLTRLIKPCREAPEGARLCAVKVHERRLVVVAGLSEPRRNDLVTADLWRAIQRVKKPAQVRIVFGIGRQVRGLEGIRGSYREAVQAAATAGR